ncbi:hypothetical protein A6V29_05085 [Blastococcus sp. CCUG 61487]|nr:hypothetical protein A6V29_05085 [Blastococcus sp. CCUG 61487]
MQRGDRDGPTVDSLILEKIDDLKSHVVRLETGLGNRVEQLSQQFVPRAEYESRHSDVRNEITKTDARVEAVKAELASRITAESAERKTLEEKLAAARRFAVSTSIAGFGSVVGLLSLILTNLPS